MGELVFLIVRLGGKVVELHLQDVGPGGHLHGVQVGASDDEEQNTGNPLFFLSRSYYKEYFNNI